MDSLFGIGLPPLASSSELKKILKSPANIIYIVQFLYFHYTNFLEYNDLQ